MTENPNANTRDYAFEDADGNPTGICGDCNTPSYYDTTDEAYHHAVNCERGCFLIPSEDREDDTFHPLHAAYTTFEKVLVTWDDDAYGAVIQVNETGTLFRLHWTDYVCGDWTEDFYSTASALCRLASLETCKAHDWSKGFAMEPDAFASAAHTFLTSTLS